MASILEIEKAASRLRHHLNQAPLPELKLLCGLKFFGLIELPPPPQTESYLREFVPTLAAAASKSNPGEFLPKETESLSRLVALLKEQSSTVSPNDLKTFEDLLEKIQSGLFLPAKIDSALKGRVRVACLFIEYYPDLDLSPRGRLLNLYVSADKISSKTETDDIVVRNPVEEPDDRFLTQARDSIKAARRYLHEHYHLGVKKRYRFDFAVDSTGARFTGDSLGVAFAVGAIAALSRVEVFSDKISVPPDIAFTGALSSDGELTPIDAEALKLKIFRAFHSDMKYLIIPREHITEGWQYISELEQKHPGLKLELVGKGDLPSVATDSRLLSIKKLSFPSYVVRKAAKASRSTWVEIPALIILLAILFILLAPARWMPWFDNNPDYLSIDAEKNEVQVCNRGGHLLWVNAFACNLEDQHCKYETLDLIDDPRNEVIFLAASSDKSEINGRLYFYSPDGEILAERYCPILNEYPRDSAGTFYKVGGIKIAHIKGRPLIITGMNQEIPARSHIRIWNNTGDSIGWYVNSGHTSFDFTFDLDGDQKIELLFTGINNRMGCAVVFALPSDSAYGVSPPYDDSYYPGLSKVKPGNQTNYILFPTTRLGDKDLGKNYNSISGSIQMENDSSFRVDVVESDKDKKQSLVLYYLDKSLRVTKAVVSDRFRGRWGELVADGKLEPVDWGEYQDILCKNVTYWTASGWVTEAQLRAAERQ